jgi:hypothetical protein
VNVLDSAWGACDMGRFMAKLDLEFSDKVVPAFTGKRRRKLMKMRARVETHACLAAVGREP